MGIFDFKRKNDIYDEIEDSEEATEAVAKAPAAEPVKRQPSPPRATTYGALRMQLLRPTDFTEAPKVADYLKAGQAVVLNLENMAERDARRMIDYVAGVLYAVDGKIERPAQRTFLLTPRGVSVASEEVAQLRPES